MGSLSVFSVYPLRNQCFSERRNRRAGKAISNGRRQDLGSQIDRIFLKSFRTIPSASRRKGRTVIKRNIVLVEAVNTPTRLSELVVELPTRLSSYMSGKYYRPILWRLLAFLTGFYVANMISLSFGNLAVNDVAAGAVCAAFAEAVSKAWHVRKRGIWLWLLQYFKLGLTLALFTDAFKLGG
ncbi:hypothetical protein CYMTET_9402 [Cymbomonas tetramitiformis]|uniref:Ycf20 n=1 Tax=Cymbomonas tetramitiformis TaxID=36881 RepID=A0AAE0GR60_9CHLO|nr:hypothetical protein CYMTET_9402 [Cymbomonas tetramitiformis]